MRVYFDASVIIAALLSHTGGSALLLEYAKRGKISGITSQTAIDEILDKTDKLNKSIRQINYFIAESGLIIRESITRKEIEPYRNKIDIKDAHLIAGANLTRSAYLITLDKKHLLREDIQNKFLPLHIVSPKELLLKVLIISNNHN